MGHVLSKVSNLWHGFIDNPVQVCMLGLDSAGKTTVLYRLKLKESVSTIPTVGFNVETIEPCDGLTLTVWDVGGQGNLRSLWKPYYQSCDGLVYVVDSADKARFKEAKEVLFRILGSSDMTRVPVLVFANKQDLPGSVAAVKLAEELELTASLTNPWYIQSCCALTADGLADGFTMFSDMLKHYRKQRKS
ncbi:uncharacterized protein LOC143453131 [Clavelina lepadiformis]|uniref:uncharacterized protein LOC143453131 n=1 Tax=Clavelina lepadiformis TaxID=159417 RepID=UPI004042154E